MQKQSNNVVYGQNLAVLTAAAELAYESIADSLGSESSAGTLEGRGLTQAELKASLVARILKSLT